MPQDTLPIFISYASYDNNSHKSEKRWLDRLLQFLEPLSLDSKVSSWADTEIKPGSNWKYEIKEALEKAKVAILLVSPAFLASEFIISEELPRLLSKADSSSEHQGNDEDMEGTLIIPIILRPCLKDVPTFDLLDAPSEQRQIKLTDFQYLPKSIEMNGLSQHKQDKIFEKVARRIIEVLDPDDYPNPSKAASSGPKQPKNKDLAKKLTEFLKAYPSYWFNALRINKWGASQKDFQQIGDFSLHEIKYALNELAEDNKILQKSGKQSTVYKTL